MCGLRTWSLFGLIVGTLLSQIALGQAPEPRRTLLDFMERQPTPPATVAPAEPRPTTEVQSASPTPMVLPASMGASIIDKKPETLEKLPKPVTKLPPVETKPTTLPTDTVCEGVVVEEPKSAWLNHPKVRLAARPGWFIIQPKGCGYYSLADCVHDKPRTQHAKSAYPPNALMPPSFFDADFTYVDDPKNTDYAHTDPWHRIHVGDNWLFGTGGQAWWRGQTETNSRLSGRNNSYDLVRGRIFGDLWYKDKFRIFGEFITAWSFNQDLAPLVIDENRADIQNLFMDVNLGEIGCNPVYLRLGRQEMSFGSQRLISPPDFANTRRTFQGARLFRQSEKFDFDLFWTRPVVPQARAFDSWDDNQTFAGGWATYRPKKGQVADLYYLYLDNTNTVTQQGVNVAPVTTHTMGARYAGDQDNFLWDFEGMYQTGNNRGNGIKAGNVTAGLGYHFKDAPMNPIVWAYYDWASGDGSPNAGSSNTFNQLFPFGHYYFGFLDLVGRQNIRDFSLHTYFFPAKWITVNAQYHFLSLDRAKDALYNAGGNAIRSAPKGNAGGTIGQELDLTVNFHLGRHSDVLIGYSILQAGDFIRNTGNGANPETAYFIYNFRW